MPTFPHWYRLPTNYSTNIGRVVTRYAFFEAQLRHAIYLLLDIDVKAGRVAVRNPRLDDAITMILDLMAVKSIKTSIDLKFLRKECKKIESFRDKISHGVWVKHSGTKLPVLQVTAGSYARTQGGESVKARITPQALAIGPDDFKSFLRAIDIALEHVGMLRQEIHQQIESSRKKSLSQ